jgi:hypothetical protein
MIEVDCGRAPRWLLGVATAVALAGCGSPPGAVNGAATATPVSFPAAAGGPTTFTDPTNDAFTLSVPQGWTVKGGTQGATPITSTSWVVATSPDGATTIELGDPTIPPYAVPNAVHPAGSTMQVAGGATAVVEPYEPGAQFAQDYASHALGQTCPSLTPTGSQAEPGLVQIVQAQAAQAAQAVGVPQPPAQLDGASVTFACQSGGSTTTVGVMVVTRLMANAVGGSWGVPLLIVYRTPTGSQAQTDQIARAMRSSFQPTPQWTAKQVAATRQALAAIQQNGAAAQAALGQQEQAESAALAQQGQVDQTMLNNEHAATMNQLNSQAQSEQQTYAQQQYNRDTNQQSEMRYIQNQQCVQWYDAAHTRCAVTAPN